MRLKDLSIEEVSEMIIERYEEEYCQMDDDRALAFLLLDARRLKPELKLAIAYAGQYLFKNKPQGWRSVQNKIYSSKNILKLPEQIRVLMLPSWIRAEMLMSHPRYIELVKLEEIQSM